MKEYVNIKLIDEAYRDCCKHKGGTDRKVRDSGKLPIWTSGTSLLLRNKMASMEGDES